MCKSFILNNGVEIPAVGYGTFPLKEELNTIVPEAIKAGYQLFDTAWLYKNEEYLGKALKDYVLTGGKRSDFFVTSKVNCYQIYAGNLHHKLRKILPPYKSVKKAYRESCERLGLEWVDLYLIHYPYPNFEYYWEQMVGLYSQKEVRAIGVSSFSQKDLERLASVSEVKPSVNQIEMSPYNTNKGILGYCKAHEIQVEAFSPFGRGLVTSELMKEPILCRLAKEKNKSVAQIILRWLNQCGVVVIPRSSNASRIKENIDIWGFELSEDEIKEIDSLNKNLSTINGVRH